MLGKRAFKGFVSSAVCIGLGLGVTVAAPAIAAAPDITINATPSVVPKCAWPVITNANQANVAYPDTSATYWTTPYRVEPGTKLVVSGSFVDARFMSFNTYDSSGGAFEVNGVPSGIFDYQIEPNAGSKNPWQTTKARGDIPSIKNSFRITVRSDVTSASVNTIPIAPTGTAAGTTGFLLMRVYLPKNGDFSAVKLPNVTVVSATSRTTITPCSPKQRKGPSKKLKHMLINAIDDGSATVSDVRSAPCRGSACPPDLQFFRALPATTNAVFPNSASAYVSALFRPDPRRVVLVRAKAPRTPGRIPPGTQPEPWPSKRFDLQYFSMCNNLYERPWPVIINTLSDDTQDPGCRADKDTKIDRRGRYTYVVASEAQRISVTKWSNTTFVPTATKQSHHREVLIFRNMLSNPDFTQSALNAPQTSSPADSAAAMGKYYPRTVSCPIKYYLTKGPTACFQKY